MINKTIITFLIILILSIPLAAKVSAFTLDEKYKPNNVPTFMTDKSTWDEKDLSLKIAILLQYLLRLAGVVTVFFIIFSGFKYATSIGQTEKVDAAKKSLTWAILGFVVVIFSYAIIQNIIAMLVAIPAGATP